MRPYRGHKLWKMNTKGEISEVGKDEYESYYDFSRKANVKKLIVEPDTLYASALNEKNARKKFDKLIKENSYQESTIWSSGLFR